ncbi:helix-turn-helix transcriptional regulator [Actinokineospora auranticolor]|uniref:Transcriptional regulator with XRE-family HTH domain n=1 Tax=Actinokineospora auranticolor TaxID=155976 RepID=A0A2S6GDB2_9PSEU|nr:helix-turn-helix transcriptional regulator [Actinokineospora auranticolor]PPK63238.1 transcriptional regulator with XRE-family HTH domain [Actinokineospora auranticolor]
MTKTPKAVALGNALRVARKDRRYSLRECAHKVGCDISVLSRWETGDRVPAPEVVGHILGALAVRGPVLKGIMSLTRDIEAPFWVAGTPVERERQLVAYGEFERDAEEITLVSPLTIPELLRTPDTTAAVVRSQGVAEDGIADQVASIVARQQNLVGADRPAKVTAFIGATALRQTFGSPRAALAQLGHLIAMAAHPTIVVRAIRDSGDTCPPTQTSTLLHSRDLHTAITDCHPSPVWAHLPDHLRPQKRAIARLFEHALPPDESLGFISNLAHRHRDRTDPDFHDARAPGDR